MLCLAKPPLYLRVLALLICLFAEPISSFSSSNILVSHVLNNKVTLCRFDAAVGTRTLRTQKAKAIAVTAGAGSVQSVDDLKLKIETAVLNTDAGN